MASDMRSLHSGPPLQYECRFSYVYMATVPHLDEEVPRAVSKLVKAILYVFCTTLYVLFSVNET